MLAEVAICLYVSLSIFQWSPFIFVVANSISVVISAQLTLERETGVINGCYSDDLLFLRQLVLDGQWEDTIEFIQPLASLPSFDAKRFTFTVLRAKFVELLCIKSEAPIAAPDAAVDTVVDVLKEIETVAPTKEHYSNLCLLLTMNKLSDHPDYRCVAHIALNYMAGRSLVCSILMCFSKFRVERAICQSSNSNPSVLIAPY